MTASALAIPPFVIRSHDPGGGDHRERLEQVGAVRGAAPEQRLVTR
jgi:hypothetical protein